MKRHLKTVLLFSWIFGASFVCAQTESPATGKPIEDKALREQDRQFLEQWKRAVPKEPAAPKRGDGQAERARLRELVNAFVVSGASPDPEQELRFFADEAEYYDQGMVSNEFIRKDIRTFNEKWTSRRYWVGAMVEIVNGDRILELETIEVRYPIGYIIKSSHEQRIGRAVEMLELRRTASGWEIISVKTEPGD